MNPVWILLPVALLLLGAAAVRRARSRRLARIRAAWGKPVARTRRLDAIALLRLHGAPEELLKRALATAERLDYQRRVTSPGATR